MADAGALYRPLELSPSVGISDGGIVEGRPKLRAGQQLLGLKAHFLYVIHGKLTGWAQVLIEQVALPDIHNPAVIQWSLHNRDPYSIPPGNQDASGSDKASPRISDRRNMALKKRDHASQIGDHDVGSHGQRYPAGNVLDEFDSIRAAVCGGEVPGHLYDVIRLK